MKLEFISYDGDYPNLCAGLLVFALGDITYKWRHALVSGGICSINPETVTDGAWAVSFPDNFPEEYKEAVIEMVNNNIPLGCCGGCL